VRVLLDDTFATATFTVPLASDWVTPPDGVTLERRTRLAASDVSAGDMALLPSSELLLLQGTHSVIPDIAVVADKVGAVALRTPVRPDEIQATPVRLLDASGFAELLARATLQPFYGIVPTGWVRDDEAPDAARAQAVIAEGAEALREPEGGFSEDLVRAWFILSAQPAVSHILLAPRDLPAQLLREGVAVLEAARSAGLARRREWRPALAEREGIAPERGNAFWAAQRLSLDDADRESLLDLLRRGTRGTSALAMSNVEFRDGA
jgi:hypothetical protein